MSIEVARRYFTVAEFHRMGEAGIFSEDDRVELVEGEVLRMSPIGRLHAGCVNRVNRLFSRLFGQHAIVSVQNPVELDEATELQPDIALLHLREDCYSGAIPTTADIFVIVEIGDSSVDFDQNVKLPLYARAGILEVLLVNLPAGTVEACHGLDSGSYLPPRLYRRGESLSLESFPDVIVQVDDILGP